MSEKSLRKLVEQHYDRIFRAARFMCGDVQAAEDLTQETFLAAANSLDRFEGRSSVYTWLYGILLNKFRRWLRKRDMAATSLQGLAEADEHLEVEDILQPDHTDPSAVAERRETVELVRAAIAGLSADHRAVIGMRYIEGMPYQEIADVLECPIGTVKSRIHYALRKIADELAGPDEEGG